ncbi:MAG: hypothetical protein L0Y71_24345 [Gemmataceae bacterium]|nr:hypothetical protein [Gemmataceae bacterium]
MNASLIAAASGVCLLVALSSSPSAGTGAKSPDVKAFPGAEGWGAATAGGRGGKIIHVRNRNASGPGSLAEACATEGPRIVVFDVSGVIRGNIRITKPHITIAGQTAPGAGITIEGMISTYDHGVHDIIVRHLRVRRNRDKGSGGDCIQMGGLGPRKTGTYNIILDHLSLCWGNDEVIDLYHAHDVTVQWCSVEESDDQGHSKGPHNYGIISAAEDNGAVSVHHNLWAHHARRVPCLAPYRPNAAGDFCNNLIYNCRGGYTDDGHGNRARSPVNLHKNYYKRGPQTMARMYPFALSPHMDYYVKDNYFEDWPVAGRATASPSAPSKRSGPGPARGAETRRCSRATNGTWKALPPGRRPWMPTTTACPTPGSAPTASIPTTPPTRHGSCRQASRRATAIRVTRMSSSTSMSWPSALFRAPDQASERDRIGFVRGARQEPVKVPLPQQDVVFVVVDDGRLVENERAVQTATPGTVEMERPGQEARIRARPFVVDCL